ncbi:MAG: tetratricopeptide repeat-containing protein [Terrimicrobiaceae bacterium]
MQDKSQSSPESIDDVARAVEALAHRLRGGEKIPSRELRRLWNQRLRSFWRLNIDIYRGMSRRFLEQGDNYLASEVADEASQFFGDDVVLILTRALATARSGAPQSAQALLRQKQAILSDAQEANSLLARTFKDLWKSSGEERYLKEAFRLYHLDYTTTRGDRSFPGVNAASMAFFLGERDAAQKIAGEVLELLRSKPDTSSYWDQVTIAECLLVSGQIEPSRAAYAGAAGRGQVAHAHLATTRGQARLLLRKIGQNESAFDSCFPLPGVIAFTGHRIDDPGRGIPRFPDSLAPVVKEQIREMISKSGAGFGYASAANGADILFLECMQEAGLETYVHLPLPEEDFLRESVWNKDSPAWLERFHKVTANATEFTCASHAGHGALDFSYGNRLMFGAARQRARQLGSELHMLAVWDGIPAERNSGGTGDYVTLAQESGCVLEIIQIGEPPVDRVTVPAATAQVSDQLLSVLTLFLPPGESSESRVASLAAEAIHSEVSDNRIRIFFQSPVAAARAALAIRNQMAEMLSGALGLHVGPARLATHPLTGKTVYRGPHGLVSDQLAALTPAGLIYASSAFSALLGLHDDTSIQSEFLGYRSLQTGRAREPVFQVIS